MLNLNVDLFKEKRKDIFMQRRLVPTQTGFQNAPWANFGKVTNAGFEVTMNFKKQWSQDFFTSAYFNFTYAKNEVVEKDEPDALKGTHRSQTGRSMNELWGLTAERLFTYDDFNEDNYASDELSAMWKGATLVYEGTDTSCTDKLSGNEVHALYRVWMVLMDANGVLLEQVPEISSSPMEITTDTSTAPAEPLSISARSAV